MIKFTRLSSYLGTLALTIVSSLQAQVLITNSPASAGQASYDFGPVVISAYLGASAPTPNALINTNSLTFLGVLSSSGNVNAINDADGLFGGADQERLQLTLDAGYGLSAFTYNFSRANGTLATDGVSISGFLADPGATFAAGSLNGVATYSAGVLNFKIPGAQFSGTIRTVTFSNLAASDGATLEFVVADSGQAAPQLATQSFTVQAVPEPTALALLLMGSGLLGWSLRRPRRQLQTPRA